MRRWPARLLSLLTVALIAATLSACQASATSKADFTQGLTRLIAPNAKNEVLAASFVDCIYGGLSHADRQSIAQADTESDSHKVTDDVTVRMVRRAAHCDRGETEQLIVDSTATVSQSLGLTANQKTCVAQNAVSAISDVDDKKLSSTNQAVQNGFDTALARSASLRDFLERSLEESGNQTNPSCVADYAAKHLTWAQVLAGSNKELEPVFDAAAILCVGAPG